MASNRFRYPVRAALIGLAIVSSLRAEPLSEDAVVTVGLPQGKAAEVAISLSDGAVSLDLPAGAEVPKDLAAASGGLVRSGAVAPARADRMRLDLSLAEAALSGVTYASSSVTLRFRRVPGIASSSEDPSGRYVLGADDKLRIAVNGSEEFTQESVVTRNGTVSAPLVGDVPAAGLSVDAFTARLTELLERDYLVSPKVDVQVLEYRSQWVMVTGEVKKAGRVFLHGPATLKEVLAEAEGYTAEAGETVTISRQSAGVGSATLDRGAFERGEINPSLKHGDIVTVEPAAYCFVNGEVKSPGNVKITRGMTLMRAISMAGGLTDWANRKEVSLSRKGSDAPPKVYNLNRIESNPELDPPLSGGELIVVKRRFL
jgi:polysaccharide export outer membrane protein